MSNMPKYIEISHMIDEDIQNGVYQINDFLPNEKDLEKKYDASRTTIRKAVLLLKDRGIVDVKQGRGTKVCDVQTTQVFNKVTSFTETLKRKGYDVRPKDMTIEVIDADEKLSSELELTPGDKVAVVHRLQLADGEPVAIMTNYIPYSMAPGIEKYENEFTALYQFLEKTYGITVESTQDRINATNASFLEAQALNVRPREAIINVRRICYNKEIPVTVDYLNIIGSKYVVEINTRERQKYEYKE